MEISQPEKPSDAELERIYTIRTNLGALGCGIDLVIASVHEQQPTGTVAIALASLLMGGVVYHGTRGMAARKRSISSGD